MRWHAIEAAALQPRIPFQMRPLHFKAQRVEYRGRLVTFVIPSHWTATYEEQSGGEFFDPEDESLTLRLSVLTLTAPKPIATGDEASVLYSLRDKHGGHIEPAMDGQFVCLCPPYAATEAAQDLLMYPWGLSRVVPPATARLAMFTLTILKADQVRLAPVVDFLKDSVRKASIAADPPSQPTTASPQSWWRRLLGG